MVSLRDAYLELSREEPAPSRARVELLDKTAAALGPITGYSAVEFDFDVLEGGAGTVTVAPDLDESIMLITAHPDEWHFLSIDTDGYRWDGFVVEPHMRKADGVTTVDVECAHVWHIPAAVRCWRSPTLGLVAQPKDPAVYHGPCMSLARQVLAENLDRLAAAGRPLPVTLVPPAAGTDTSANVAVEANFQRFGDMFRDAFRQAGVFMTVSLWRPGDPVPAGAAVPDGPTLMVDIRDRKAFSGFVDASDGDPIVQFRRVLAGEGFEPVWEPAGEGGPWVAWRLDGPGVESFDLGVQRAQGASVSWLGRRTEFEEEKLREVSTTYVRAESANIRGDVWGQGLFLRSNTDISYNTFSVLDSNGTTSRTVPRGSGAGSLSLNTSTRRAVDSQDPEIEQEEAGAYLHTDTLIDTARKDRMGRFAIDEHVITGSNADEVVGALYELRGQYSLIVSVVDGVPFRFGRDFHFGDPVVFQVPHIGKRYYDVATNAHYVDDEANVAQWTVGFGYPPIDPPSVDALKRARRLEEWKSRIDTEVRL